MRTEKEMFDLILGIALKDERIRAVYMNGSRTNLNAPRDIFQDYDIVYVVTETASFIKNGAWINVFGDLIMMQEPDKNDQSIGIDRAFTRSYGYLMLFTDGNRIDLQIETKEFMLESYVSDKLTIPLLDKDNCLPIIPAPSDIDYQLVEGIDYADSITIDAHKWLNVPYDSAMQFTRHKQLQVEVFQNNAAYLGGSIENPDFFDLTPENSRRFRALPAWFTLKAYGKRGYQYLIEQNVELAQRLGDKIKKSGHFKLLSPVRLNVVCFTLDKEAVTTEMIKQFLALLNQQGKVFMTPTTYKGVPAIRAAFSNWRTAEKDLEIIWDALKAYRCRGCRDR